MKISPLFPHLRTSCCIVVLLAGYVVSQAEPLAARVWVKTVNGNATCSTNGTVFNPLHVGGYYTGSGFVINSGSKSTVDLILPDSGTVLRMLPNSSLKFIRLDKEPAGEQLVTDTSLRLLKGSVVGAQRKLAVPSHFAIFTSKTMATIVGTEYVVNADGAVSVLEGAVSINYNLPSNKGSVKVSIPAGSTFDPATQTVVPTSSQFLQNIIADVNTVKQNARTFKIKGATIVIKEGSFITPIHGHGNNGVGNGKDPQPPGNPPVNDGPGTGPGNPGNKGGAHK